tara:strand:+ start:916 stop:1065 length:150 start_codon:yes stop_codon:yes gene_type:complete
MVIHSQEQLGQHQEMVGGMMVVVDQEVVPLVVVAAVAVLVALEVMLVLI